MPRVPVEPYYDEARAHVLAIAEQCHLTCAVLDDWGAPRIIYDAPCVASCASNCDPCPLYQVLDRVVGKEDAKLPRDKFRKTLGIDQVRQDMYPWCPQRYLNCKTWKQYLDCYLECLVHHCPTEKEVDEELDYVKHFLVLYVREETGLVLGETDLARIEKGAKRALVRRYLEQIWDNPKMYKFAMDCARKKGLIS